MKTEKKSENYSYSIVQDTKEIVSVSASLGADGAFNFNISISEAESYHANSTEVNSAIEKLLEEITAQAKTYIATVNQKAGVMELKQLVEQHETKLKQHDKELSRLNDMSVEMQKQMSEGLARVDESNRFLREQNTRQSEQNAQILQAVIKGNESSDERQFQLKLLDKTNFWKLIFGIGGASAAIYTIIMEVIKLIR